MGKWGSEGLIFIGCMFVGGGVGTVYGNSYAGWLIGMGAGFIGMAVARLLRK